MRKPVSVESDNKSTDQPVHLSSLISVIVITSLNGSMATLAIFQFLRL